MQAPALRPTIDLRSATGSTEVEEVLLALAEIVIEAYLNQNDVSIVP